MFRHLPAPAAASPPGMQDGVAGDFKFITYKEASELVAQIAGGIAKLGLKRQDRVGVYGANCEEWMIAMQARVWRAPLDIDASAAGARPAPAPRAAGGRPGAR
jgi:long-subunit acyl-CoA synthetase (AMP-forming)